MAKYDDLQGKVVLITGANHGIGAATARAFARQGCMVFITYYRLPYSTSAEERQRVLQTEPGGKARYDALQNTHGELVAEEIRAEGGQAQALELDLGDAENIARLFERCEQAFGQVDVLVNNHTYDVLETFDPARVTNEGFPVSLVSAAEIDRHFVINSRAYALLMSEYIQCYMRRGGSGGRIINLSTDAAHAHESNVSYAASKHAIESYTRSAAIEVGKYGITVNVVAPGPVQTGYITPQVEKSLAAGTPLGRLGLPGDIADVVVFLASEDARWLTGQVLYAGGGWRMGQ
jgi:3-oxoacyl-[acyl-carrier protein] reductase